MTEQQAHVIDVHCRHHEWRHTARQTVGAVHRVVLGVARVATGTLVRELIVHINRRIAGHTVVTEDVVVLRERSGAHDQLVRVERVVAELHMPGVDQRIAEGEAIQRFENRLHMHAGTFMYLQVARVVLERANLQMREVRRHISEREVVGRTEPRVAVDRRKFARLVVTGRHIVTRRTKPRAKPRRRTDVVRARVAEPAVLVDRIDREVCELVVAARERAILEVVAAEGAYIVMMTLLDDRERISEERNGRNRADHCNR